MAATQAKIGYGSLFQRGDGATPEIFTTVAEITELTPPQSEADDIEVTHMESPGRTKEYIQGLSDAGEASGKMNWLPGNATQDHLTGMLADKNAGLNKNYRIILPAVAGGLIWGFTGYVKTFNPTIDVNGALTVDWSIKVSGGSTYA